VSQWQALEGLLSASHKRGHIHINGVTLYVRHAPRMIEREVIDSVLQLASIEADVPGAGAFTTLLPALESAVAQAGIQWIYVENVLEERFRAFWLRNGYHRVDASRSEYDFCYAKHLDLKG